MPKILPPADRPFDPDPRQEEIAQHSLRSSRERVTHLRANDTRALCRRGRSAAHCGLLEQRRIHGTAE
jgi:hypothetical protein